jgi:hypothetical protein
MYVGGAESLETERAHDRRGARSLVVPNPRACPCYEAVHHARQPNPRIAALPITSPTVVATAVSSRLVSFVYAHGGDQLEAALVCHVPGRHSSHAPHHRLFRARRAWGEAPCLSHKPRLVTDLSREIWETTGHAPSREKMMRTMAARG